MSHYKTYESGRREVTFDIKLVLFSRSAVNSKFFCNFDKLFSLAEFASQLRLNIIAREICCAIASIINLEQHAKVLIVEIPCCISPCCSAVLTLNVILHPIISFSLTYLLPSVGNHTRYTNVTTISRRHDISLCKSTQAPTVLSTKLSR